MLLCFRAFDAVKLMTSGASPIVDFRPLPFSKRKARLARLLARAPAGIEITEHTDHDGAAVFRHACQMGLEGIVSKRVSVPYRSGPSRDWIKVKNPDSPAMVRAREGKW
jgi:bifunctional non-homologous end joining protein LigD